MPLDPDIPLPPSTASPKRLADYAGKALLSSMSPANAASRRNMRGWRRCSGGSRARGFAVLGFPCDQFGHQEPGDEAAIQEFCTPNLRRHASRCSPRSRSTAPARIRCSRRLKQAAPGLLGTQAIKWNFTKFLVGRDGEVLRRYAPTDAPASLAGDIEAALQ